MGLGVSNSCCDGFSVVASRLAAQPELGPGLKKTNWAALQETHCLQLICVAVSVSVLLCVCVHRCPCSYSDESATMFPIDYYWDGARFLVRFVCWQISNVVDYSLRLLSSHLACQTE